MYSLLTKPDDLQKSIDKELREAEARINEFRIKNEYTILKCDKAHVERIGIHFFQAMGFVSARFAKPDTEWGMAHVSSTILYTLYLVSHKDPYVAMREIFVYSRKYREFSHEIAEKFPAAELQLQLIDSAEYNRLPPIKGTNKIFAVHKTQGLDLLSFCFPDLPPSRLSFMLTDRYKWYRPMDEEVSMYFHCLMFSYPDVREAMDDMGLSLQQQEDRRHDDRFLSAFQTVLKHPILQSIKLEVRDMNRGSVQARRTLFKFFQDKEAVTNLWKNLTLPVAHQKDVPIDSVETEFDAIIGESDPTALVEASPLTRKDV